MTDASTSLYLVTPALADPAAFLPRLDEALRATEVAAVLIRLTPADERTLVERVKVVAAAVQAHDAAAIVADPGASVDLARIVARGGADGAHADHPARLAELRGDLKAGSSLGAGGLGSKHDAMLAGEIGVDYVLFGEPRPDGFAPPLGGVAERAAWWSEIFQIPCAAYAPDLAAIPTLAATGCEFVALGAAVWDFPDGPAAALARVRDLMIRAPEVVR